MTNFQLRGGAITQCEMFTPMLLACPTFAGAWRQFVEEWSTETELPQYLALAELARHLINLLADNRTQGFDAVFDVVERWCVEGDGYVQDAAIVGLLEDLQNTNLHTTTKPANFEPWLRPVSRRHWTKVERFWSHGELITRD